MNLPPFRRPARQPKQFPSPSDDGKNLPEMLASYERVLIIQALMLRSRAKAAASLGISRVYLWKRMKKLGIDATLFPRARTGRKKKVT